MHVATRSCIGADTNKPSTVASPMTRLHGLVPTSFHGAVPSTSFASGERWMEETDLRRP